MRSRAALRCIACFVVASFGWVPASRAGAEAARAPAPWERIEAARTLLDGAQPRAAGVELDLAMVTQEGGSVPLAVEVRSPMAEDDYVEALYLFASGNPSPELAEFRFRPRAGQARVSTRIRLDRSQTVVALARTSRGEWLAGARDIRVTVSGCLTRGGAAEAGELLQTRVRVPTQLRAGEVGDVRTLIVHPMETGLRQDPQGKPIPERIIRSFQAELDGEAVLEAKFYRAIAANPFLHFAVAPQRSGTLRLKWEEDTGRSVIETAEISVP